MNWKETLSPELKSYLEELLAETGKHKTAYHKAPHVSKAQLWVALAHLSRRISLLEQELKERKNSERKLNKLNQY